jgi:parallel beta-helix repeat protein
VIDKPLEIVGEGNREDVVVEATGKDAVLFQASMGRVANLTLRQAGGGLWDAVDIAQGRLDLEDCDISSQGRVGVAIHDGAEARVRRNRIHNGKSGVLVYENGAGLVEDNDILSNAYSGIEVREGGDPVVRGNRIRGNRDGIWVHTGGRGTFENNVLGENKDGAWDIAKDCEANVKRSGNVES